MDGQLDTSSPEPAGLEEHGSDPSSPVTGVVDNKVGSSNSPSKRSRRAVMKRVLTVPIADIEGSRLKGEGAPPPDSWSWRKYGQKPIKGSPYPRAYYRCSSSKGCPARKQVERSRANPTMLIVTYASDHNHSWSSTRSSPSTVAAPSVVTSPPSPASPKLPAALSSPSVAEDDDKFGAAVGDDALLHDEFGWFSDVVTVRQGESTLHSPICSAGAGEGGGVVYQMGEEEESLFADLGELPECSVVLRRASPPRRRSAGPPVEFTLPPPRRAPRPALIQTKKMSFFYYFKKTIREKVSN